MTFLKLEQKPQQNSRSPQSADTITFGTLLLKLPQELVCEILHHWMAPELLNVKEDDSTSDLYPFTSSSPTPNLPLSASGSLYVTYTCATDEAANTITPANLRDEYWRTRRLNYLNTSKAFRNPYDFYMSHYVLSIDPIARLPPFDASPDTLGTHTPINFTIQPLIQLPHDNIHLHGLEKIELDFDASQYFALFNVHIPPFDITDTTSHGDELHPDSHLHGAASLLQHCRHLTLHFSDAYKWAHPWFNLKGRAWADARCQPRVCESGFVVDWILEYAWHGKFLQHLDGFEIRGDVQQWVRAKWTLIFAKHIEQVARWKCNRDADIDSLTVHEPNIEAIERFGTREDELWRPEELFPPVCECAVGCWRLQGGRVLEDRREDGWDGEVEVDVASGVTNSWDDVDY